jgi:hypothetical protein
MEKFLIKTHGSDQFIVNQEHGFTLKVIPPGKQPYAYEPGRQVVGVEFPGPRKKSVLQFDEPEGYDFEGVDIAYFDADRGAACNKELWFETIEYFCQLILDREPVSFFPYNYDYVLTKKKNTLAYVTLPILTGNGNLKRKLTFLN